MLYTRGTQRQRWQGPVQEPKLQVSSTIQRDARDKRSMNRLWIQYRKEQDSLALEGPIRACSPQPLWQNPSPWHCDNLPITVPSLSSVISSSSLPSWVLRASAPLSALQANQYRRVNRPAVQGPTEMCAPSATLTSVGEDVAWGESWVMQGWGSASQYI